MELSGAAESAAPVKSSQLSLEAAACQARPHKESGFVGPALDSVFLREFVSSARQGKRRRPRKRSSGRGRRFKRFLCPVRPLVGAAAQQTKIRRTYLDYGKELCVARENQGMVKKYRNVDQAEQKRTESSTNPKQQGKRAACPAGV